MNYTLASHPKAYNCSLKEWAFSPIVSPYAQRHFQLADSAKAGNDTYWQGHKIIAIIQSVPLIGLVASLLERITAYIFAYISHQPKTLQNSINTLRVNPKPLDFDWKKLAQIKKTRENAARQLAKRFYSQCYRAETQDCMPHLSENRTDYDAYMGKVFSVPAEFSMWMPGVALIASQLAEKKKLQGLYVCHTLEAFASKLHEVSNNPNDQRCAFIVSGVMSGFNPFDNYKTNFPQHKCTACVEKKNGQLTIALLDGQPMKSNREIRPSQLKNDIWEGYEKNDEFNSQELIFRAILKGVNISKHQVRLMHSQVVREREFGCEVFALRDAITFLQDPDFYNKVELHALPTKIDEKNQIEVITRLPPEFMVGTQSYQLLDLYKANIAESVLITPLIGKKSKKSFNAVLQDNQIEAVTSKGIKLQNHYITRKCFKYLHSAVHMIETMPPKDLQSLANKTLLTKVNRNLLKGR